MNFDWHMWYPLHTQSLWIIHRLLGVFPAERNCAIFQNGFSAPVLGWYPFGNCGNFGTCVKGRLSKISDGNPRPPKQNQTRNTPQTPDAISAMDALAAKAKEPKPPAKKGKKRILCPLFHVWNLYGFDFVALCKAQSLQLVRFWACYCACSHEKCCLLSSRF